MRNKILLLGLMVAVLLHSEASVAGAAAGLSYVLSVLIPSLFPFMILSAAFSSMVKSPNPFLVFLISVLGGYPVAAKCLENENLSKDNASMLIYVCVNPGVSFMSVIVSKTLIQNSLLGLLVTLSVYISSFINFLFVYFIYKPELSSENIQKFDLVSCVSSSIKSIINMSAFVIVFSSLEYLIFSYKIGNMLYSVLRFLKMSEETVFSLLSGMLEISSGITSAITCGCRLEIVAALLSFGGICVQFQIFSIVKEKFALSKLKYYFFRITHVALSIIILNILKHFIKVELSVISTPDAYIPGGISRIIPATISLILMALVFLLTIKNDVEITKKV